MTALRFQTGGGGVEKSDIPGLSSGNAAIALLRSIALRSCNTTVDNLT